FAQAVKLRTSTDASLRSDFDSLPKFVQASLFAGAEVLAARRAPFDERYAASKAMKDEGNGYFAAGRFDEAINCYEKALSVFIYLQSRHPDWKRRGIRDEDLSHVNFTGDASIESGGNPTQPARVAELKLSLYLNLALALHRRRDFPAAIAAADAALGVQPRCPKALFRRAMARTAPASAGATELDMAVADLAAAATEDPADCAVAAALARLRAERRAQRRADKATFAGMFNRGEVYVSDDDEGGGEHLERQAEEAERAGADEDAAECRRRAGEYRTALADAKRQAAVTARRERGRLDWLNPTPKMIEEARRDGVDLNDLQVRAMMAELEAE
ncbi:unnamed protein product, partial [Phaeothamnion confervicola]